MNKTYKVLSQKIVHSNPYYKVWEDKYQLSTKKTAKYYGIKGLRTVFVIPFVSKNEMIVINQYRYLAKNWSLEFPAGRIETKYENSKKAAARELEEEIGYKAGKISYMGKFMPCKGLSDEICFIFKAIKLKKTKQQLDKTEKIIIKRISIKQFEKKIKTGKIQDGMTLASWIIYKGQL